MSDLFDRLSKLSQKQLLLLALDQQEQIEMAKRREREPIAIIGIGCRFPGGADSPQAFWELLRDGRDAIREVPSDRWDIDTLFDPDPDGSARMAVRAGGFLDDVSGFDAAFFGIAPREALTMDPQQRLLLEVTWEALENAGLAADRLVGSPTGVFIGLCNSDYFHRLMRRGNETIDAYLASGNAPSVAAGRISYALGLRGPSLVVDTSCSSSLVAVHLACRSLRSGETRVALAGAANVICAPETMIALSKARMLAPDGRCKTFDASADGFSRGEGCGVVVLKRLGDAVADGDNILAVIRGTAINQDGRSGGLTVPNGPAQEDVIRAALLDAGASADEIDYVEAHGTGTSLGDPIEVRALGSALCAGRMRDAPLLIGSVKTNLGHLESAAGVAGMIKVVLALQNERIPPHLHFHQPSPHIPWAEYSVSVAATGAAWRRAARARMAGVSSFGFSGTNAHVVLEEAPPARPNAGAEERSFYCVPLSARSDAALSTIAARYAQVIASRPELALANLVCTVGAGRSHFPHRLAVVADSMETAANAMRAFADGKPHPALHAGIVVPGQAREVVFLFAGECSQSSGMGGRLLYDMSSVYRAAIDQCDHFLGPDAAGRTLNSVLWSSSGEIASLDDPAWRQPALFAVQYATTRLWQSFGVEPAAVIGSADGEIVAACVAGVLSLEDGLQLITQRAGRAQNADATQECASAVTMSRPRVPVAWTATGSHALNLGDVPDTSYWQAGSCKPDRFEDGITLLHQAGYRIFLDVAPEPTLIALARRSLPDGKSLFLTSLRRGADDWSVIAESLAQLYVYGMPISWADVSKGACRIPLPTYPFEHRSYWYSPAQLENQGRILTPGGVVPSDARDGVTTPTDDGLFYQVQWESAPLPTRAAPLLLGPEQFGAALRERFAILAAHHELSVYDQLLPKLDQLSVEYVAKALRQLGFDTTVGRVFVPDQEAARLGVAPRHFRLFRRLLDMLAEDGVVRCAGSALEIVGPLPAADPEQHLRDTLDMFRHVDGEVGMLQRSGNELSRVLTGEQDPLQLLFPGGSFIQARKLYVESPFARTYNSALGEALTSAIANLTPGTTLRVLEIGAGTGGTTSYVLPLLPSHGVSYTFTDVSPLFLERAATQFAAYPFMLTALLDIEKDPFEQGFLPGQFDVIISANALHATQDLTETVRHVRGLLAPRGLLFLLEGVRTQRWTSITFGLIEGWWRFQDTALRANDPLVGAGTWRGLLEDQGFDDFVAIPGDASGPISEREQVLLIARAAAAVRRWVVVGDCDGVGAALAWHLRARGDAVVLLNADATEPTVQDGDHLVYLGALELTSRADEEFDAAQACMALAAELPIRWLGGFGRGTQGGRAWLVTRGAQAVRGRSSPGGRWQAPLWGIGRAFALEQPEHWGGLVDLPPEGSAAMLAETLVAAIVAGDGEDQTAYRDGERHVARLLPASAPGAAIAQFRPDATYLITGGFGGLGLLVAHWMAEHGARHIALLGRHPDPNSDAVQALECMGTRIFALAGDVADEAGMGALLTQLAVEAPPLRGIIHAAVDVSAGRIEQLTSAQVSSMLGSKIAGTVVLERLTRSMELDFVVLFSSTAALLGYAELAHYAAANMFLDATAYEANRPGRRVLAINWGAWEDIRMASAEAQRSFRQAGLLPMSADEALDALGRLLIGSAPQGIVARIDWSRYKPLFEARRARPFLSYLGVVSPRVAAIRPQAMLKSEPRSRPDRFGESSGAGRQKLLEDFIGGAVAAVLGAQESAILPAQDLFEMGMDSLMALELKRRLEEGINGSLPANLLFNYPTVAALATLLSGLLEPSAEHELETAELPSLIREAPGHSSGTPARIYPLSYSQQALWFLHQQAPQSTAYNVSLSLLVSSGLDVAALRRALQALIDRHAILRTTYAFVDGAPCQRVDSHMEAVVDAHVDAGLTDAELRKRLEADARRQFDLEHGPLIRASVYTRGPNDHALLLSVHHISVDGWSIMLLIEELLKLYAEMTGGPAANLSQPGHEYGEYTLWQDQMLGGEAGDRLWSYWREKLAPPRERVTLPTDQARPPIQTFQGASLPLRLEAGTVQRLMSLARQERTTPFVVLMAAFQVLLSRLTGAEDIIVGTSTFARSKPEFMQVVGDFVNSVPVRGRVAAILTFRDLVAQMTATVLEAIDAQEFPLALLVQRLQPERNANSSPLFDTFFSYLRFEQFKGFGLLYGGSSDDAIEVGGLRLAPFPIAQGAGQFELSLQLVEIAGSVRGVFNYRSDLFQESTIRRFVTEYLAIVDACTADPRLLLGTMRRPIDAAAARGSDVVAFLQLLRQRDIQIFLDGDRLRVNAPKGAVDAEIRAAITAQRDDIIAALQVSDVASPECDAGPIRRIPRDGPFQVSSAQQRLWFLDQMDPGRSHYNVGGGLRYHGELDAGSLVEAIRQLVIRHESLRTRIGNRDGEPWLQIDEAADPAIEVADLSKLPPEAREADSIALAQALLRRPFDMASGPLAAFLIVRLAADEHMLVASMHHVISDGWSLITALSEICELYDARAEGRPDRLAPLPISYVDYAAWERSQNTSGRFLEHLTYWKQQLNGIPAVLELPTDHPRPAVPSFRGGRLRRSLDGDLVTSLDSVNRKHDVTLFMTLLAAWQIVLHIYSGQDDIVIGTPVANRDLPALEGVIGCLVNNLVLRSKLNDDLTLGAFLEQIKQTVLNAFDHRELPFDTLVQAINPERNTRHAPIFQVLFAFASYPVRLMAPAGVDATPLELTSGESRFDLTIDIIPVTVGEGAGKFAVVYEYNLDLYEERTVLRLHEQFVHLLENVATDSSRRIKDVPLLLSRPDQRLLDRWNATEMPHDRTRCVHHLLEASARVTPDAPAITAGDVTLNYRELDRLGNQLAHRLVDHGIGTDKLVAICLDRNLQVAVAMAGVLKAGAAYVPLDPTHPEERLRYILEDANVACVITVSHLAPMFDEAKATVLLLDELGDAAPAHCDLGPRVNVRPADLAYVIYTSGSTGRPKGVQVEHRNVVNFVTSMRREPGLEASDVMLAVTTLAFDIAELEYWLPLSVGAHVIVASRTDVLSGDSLIRLMEDNAVTVLQATPATWNLLLETGWTGCPMLKALCGGEALPRHLAAALVERVGELWNMYGPTETTIWSTVNRVFDAQGPILIGHPIGNTRVYVLDASGHTAPIGAVGELCIGGEGVARGYLNRPELTQEKFVTVTLADGTAECVYHTGDMARFRGDGQLEFLGRRDTQVKLRGHRIELGEIESVLACVVGVKQCVATVREIAPGDERLVGYVMLSQKASFDIDAVRATLRSRLPEYMVPDLFAVIPVVPLTPNGKLDRKALPPPRITSIQRDAPLDALMTPEQRRVAELWREVLRCEQVGLHDNFFDLGGHSLLLVRLHAGLKREFDQELSLVELFQRTTVAAQADRLSSLWRSGSAAVLRAQARAERQVHG